MVKQTTFRSPKGNEKQIDYILTKRRYLRYNKDAEANDMIHMGSDHRCVMATFTITTPETSRHYKTMKGKHDTIKHEARDYTGKNIEVEELELEKNIKKSSNKSKKGRHKKRSSARRKRKCRGTCQKTRMQQQEKKVNDGVETTGEAGGKHPGLHTVNEEAGHIVLHTERVEHDMNYETGKRTKTMHNTTSATGKQTEIVIENQNAAAEAEDVEGTSTEIMLNDGVEATS